MLSMFSLLLVIRTDFSGGWILRHKLDQEAAEELLQYMESKTGWSTSHLIDSLREQWQNELVDE